MSSLKSDLNVFYSDDGTIGGTLEDITADLKLIEEQGKDLGLQLMINVEKSELIAKDQSSASNVLSIFPGLQYVPPAQASLLGSPLGEEAMVISLETQIHQLKVIGERLHHLHSHDAITILHHSFAVPKLLHVLWTSPAFLSPLLLS